MKNLLIALIVLKAINISYAQTSDFRGFNWSNTLKQIETGEKSPLLKKVRDDELVYKDMLGNSDCEVVYMFNDNDKLVSGMYALTKKYSNPQLYVQDYNKFKKLLTEKYGNPITEKEYWNNNTPTEEKHHFGQAVADGNLQLCTVWNTDRSVIKITLLSMSKQPNLQINYTAHSLDELENADDLKEAIKKL